ncbi:bifunctional glycosyltransferase/CDP-glycerol:glycerophosphate glycerophosphotransferase [Streptomyces sp. CA-294286]|uniref:bifunctional glycosyltransferase/CDP-glycerol:glycerophosphate glycerophosphotransferase n=1 Tax=Streptomyces sp. CA-294286 TaxID=3240070 RepID=UPI003D8F8180
MLATDVPDVSVIIIVYNDAERIQRAVRSVLSQTLQNVEVIISDDCSTDGTEHVSRQLAASEERVRYVRLEKNSGGCSAPRNRGISVARAPYLMFLDSDDELPVHACKSLLLAAEESGADFVTGAVTRLYEETGRTELWYPNLFTEQRVVEGIRTAPEYFFDHLSTNKLYRADFISGNALRFPEGVHYEDQLFSTQAFCSAKSFGVVPWEIYTWRLAPASASISSSRHKIQNVRDRIAIARMCDAYLESSGNADLRGEKDYKFLAHDLRLYLGDLPFRDAAWISEFAEAVNPYLEEIALDTYARLRREERVCLYLLRAGRLDEAVEAARGLGRPSIAPRHTAADDGRTYWGSTVPKDEAGRAELDLSEWHMSEQSFTGGRLRHEVESVTCAGPVLRLRIRSYDPSGMLPSLSDGLEASVRLAGTGRPMVVPMELQPEGNGIYLSEVLLDLRRIPVNLIGLSCRRHPVVVLSHGKKKRTDSLLLTHPAAVPVHQTPVTYRGIGSHQVKVAPEQSGAGRLEITWHRVGILAAAEPLGPQVRAAKKRLARVKRTLTGSQSKATVYDALARLPRKRALALFEAAEGRGYTDSPRYIYEELRRRNLPIDVVWSYSGSTDSFPDDVTLVRRGSWEYTRVLARASYWVDSHNLPYMYPKPPHTRYLQTWHGQTLKTMGFDTPALRAASPASQDEFRAAVRRWDALVCPSAEFERTFIPAFETTADPIRSGYPRNDVLVRHNEPAQRDTAARIRAELEIPDHHKVLLYAPTFRDSGRHSGDSVRVDLETVAQACHEWTVVVRTHPYDKFTVPTQLRHAVRNGTDIADVNDLMLASDALLTDYSSIMFDYANTGRPILLYTDDYENYRNSERGTYYDLEEISPGPLLKTSEELAQTLQNLDATAADHQKQYAEFQEMFCSYETGQASRTVVDAFFGGNGNG